jgi:hypothetical protein
LGTAKVPATEQTMTLSKYCINNINWFHFLRLQVIPKHSTAELNPVPSFSV